MDDKGKEIVDFDGIEDRIVHYCVDNNIPYVSSSSLDQFKDPQGNLDDVKLIKAFNDPKAPLIFTPKIQIPSDAVTGSASGLDPQISPANADLQAPRVAKARGVPLDQVRSLIAEATDRPALGFIGESRVNVLLLNVSLDEKFPPRK
jgi:K+-transporting ATPase c subunit